MTATCTCTHPATDHDDYGCVACRCQVSAMGVDALAEARNVGWAK